MLLLVAAAAAGDPGIVWPGFHNSTTTARSMRSQYAMHNRMFVHVSCYAAVGDDGSEPRATIKAGCDNFVDMAGQSHQQMAERIRDDNINVLIDTTGYTMNMQTEVFAIGPSPVQVQFHGFPGTMGSEFIHYLASDRFSSPPDHADQFSGTLYSACIPCALNSVRPELVRVMAPICREACPQAAAAAMVCGLTSVWWQNGFSCCRTHT